MTGYGAVRLSRLVPVPVSQKGRKNYSVLRDALAVRREITKKIRRTSFGEVLGPEEVKFDVGIDLPFHLSAQSGSLFKTHVIDCDAEGGDVDIAVFPRCPVDLRSKYVRAQNRNPGLHQRQGLPGDAL